MLGSLQLVNGKGNAPLPVNSGMGQVNQELKVGPRDVAAVSEQF